MSISRRLVPVFAILLAGISLRIFRTANGLQWTGTQKVIYLVLGALVLTVIGNGIVRLWERRK